MPRMCFIFLHLMLGFPSDRMRNGKSLHILLEHVLSTATTRHVSVSSGERRTTRYALFLAPLLFVPHEATLPPCRLLYVSNIRFTDKLEVVTHCHITRFKARVFCLWSPYSARDLLSFFFRKCACSLAVMRIVPVPHKFCKMAANGRLRITWP